MNDFQPSSFPRFAKRQSGFTLVELSIVLVIIGLLIGGILTAQSLISSAKLNKFVKQIQQYDIAMNNFETRYNGLPGDSNLFNSVGYSAYKNNNRIDVEDSGGTAIHGFYTDTNEMGNFWLDMKNSGVLNDQNTYIAHNVGGGVMSTTPSAAHIPAAMMGNKAGIMVGYNISGQAPIFDLNGVYYIADFTANVGATTLGSSAYAFYTHEALAIDLKLDNGNSSTGTMISFGANSGGTINAYSTAVTGLNNKLFIKYKAQTR